MEGRVESLDEFVASLGDRPNDKLFVLPSDEVSKRLTEEAAARDKAKEPRVLDLSPETEEEEEEEA